MQARHALSPHGRGRYHRGSQSTNIGRIFMRTLLVAGLVIAAGLAPEAAFSQSPAPQNVVTRYLVSPLEGDATKEVRMQSVVIPPKAATRSTATPVTNG